MHTRGHVVCWGALNRFEFWLFRISLWPFAVADYRYAADERQVTLRTKNFSHCLHLSAHAYYALHIMHFICNLTRQDDLYATNVGTFKFHWVLSSDLIIDSDSGRLFITSRAQLVIYQWMPVAAFFPHSRFCDSGMLIMNGSLNGQLSWPTFERRF